MGRFLVLSLLFLFVSPSVARSQGTAADPSDVATVDAIVDALYASVNRPAGQPYDWERFLPLFLPEASLIPNVEQTGGEFTVFTPRGFVDFIDGLVDITDPEDPGFQEEEIARRVESYGDIAQVFSTYQKRFWGASEILGRGINAINLVHRDERWWVVSIVWDEDVGAGPIPGRYLPTSGGR